MALQNINGMKLLRAVMVSSKKTKYSTKTLLSSDVSFIFYIIKKNNDSANYVIK